MAERTDCRDIASFICPITREIMRDPVITCDGHSYEREAIEEWLRHHRTSPVTGMLLEHTRVLRAHALRNAIEEWEKARCARIRRSDIVPAVLDHTTLIGTGAFKKVHRATLFVSGSAHPTPVAVLCAPRGSIAAEAEVLLKLGRHPHLVRFFGLCSDGDNELLVTELAPLGSIADIMQRLDMNDDAVIPPPHKLAVLQQVASGMAALADARLIHRDLAARNVLLCGFDISDVTKTVCKVSDFGLTVNGYSSSGPHGHSTSTTPHKIIEGGPRPTRYLAPEALKRGRYSEKSDVWAFGVLAWELLTDGKIPHFEMGDDAAVAAHVCGGGRLVRPTDTSTRRRRNARVSVSLWCPDNLWAAVTMCWAEHPRERPTFRELGVTLGQPDIGDAKSVGCRQRLVYNDVQPSGSHKPKVVLPEVRRHDAPAVVMKTPAQADQSTADLYSAGVTALYGHGGESKDPAQAYGLLRKAADQGHVAAHGELGWMMYWGAPGGRADWPEAARVLQWAVDQGDTDARGHLSIMVYHGHGGLEQSSSRAAELCDGRRIAEWTARAEDGDQAALIILGQCYRKGIGVMRDGHKAMLLFRLAANQGFARAQCHLGDCYMHGTGVTKDETEAARWLRLAANQGDACAQSSLATCYGNGSGVSTNLGEALRLVRLAAAHGLALAQCNLGRCYKKGTGVAKNVDEAVRLFRLAADQGFAPARKALELCAPPPPPTLGSHAPLRRRMRDIHRPE